MGLRKKIKNILENNKINRCYGQFKTNKKIKKNWDKIYLNRISLINVAVSKVLNKKKMLLSGNWM